LRQLAAAYRINNKTAASSVELGGLLDCELWKGNIMKTETIIHNLRNPYGKSQEDIYNTRLAAADKIEQLLAAYKNLSDFAVSKGLDVTTYG